MSAAAKPRVWNLINPSDRITFVAADHDVAAAVTVCVGEGRYGADEIGGDEKVPLMMFSADDAWAKQTFGDASVRELINRVVEEKPEAFRAALASFCLGDREVLDAALAAIDDEGKRAAFVATWNDRHRSSMNDIVGYAHGLVERLERRGGKT